MEARVRPVFRWQDLAATFRRESRDRLRVETEGTEMIDALKLLLYFILYPILRIVEMIEQDKEAAEAERMWLENSFQFENGRYNKDDFSVIDGKLLVKEQK